MQQSPRELVKTLDPQIQAGVLLCFIILPLTSSFIIHLQLIFVYKWEAGIKVHFFPSVNIQSFQHDLFKGHSCYIELLGDLVVIQLTIYEQLYFWTLYSISLMYLSTLVPILHWVNYYYVCNKSWNLLIPLIFFFKISWLFKNLCMFISILESVCQFLQKKYQDFDWECMECVDWF